MCESEAKTPSGGSPKLHRFTVTRSESSNPPDESLVDTKKEDDSAKNTENHILTDGGSSDGESPTKNKMDNGTQEVIMDVEQNECKESGEESIEKTNVSKDISEAEVVAVGVSRFESSPGDGDNKEESDNEKNDKENSGNERKESETNSKEDNDNEKNDGKEENGKTKMDKAEDGKEVSDKDEDKKDKNDKDDKGDDKKAEEVQEGVDPFSTRPESPEKVCKSVTFNEEVMEMPIIQNGGTPPSSPSSSPPSSPPTSSKDTKAGEEAEGGGAGGEEVERRPGKQWNLGEGNPVYRLSMKLSPNLFNLMDIPGANQHREKAEKAGYLNKLSGRTFPYLPAQWKRRYCVLSAGRLYLYEREDSRKGDKTNGVINLEYFDQVHEAAPKECKKATNVFIITSQDRSFFDPGRHLFSADTLTDMKDWIRRLQGALEQIRNNNRPNIIASSAAHGGGKEGGGKKRKEENKEETTNEDKENKENTQLNTSSRERKKKKEDSHRPRKSARGGGGVTSETQTSDMTDSADQDTTTPGPNTPQAITSPRGGVQLPGLSSHKPRVATTEGGKVTKTTTTTKQVTRAQDRDVGDDELPTSGPTLACVTKQRVKGPQGRRAPQSHRRTMAALKQRASSLSALEHQDSADTSEMPWMNRSLDVLEADQQFATTGRQRRKPRRAPVPYKAYNYSSDEDELADDHSDSFLTSASGMPPPPPPRSASYGLDMRPVQPPPGVNMCHVMQCSLGDGQGSHDNLSGSKHSLGEWHRDPGAAWDGSRDSLGQNGEVSGGASPVMDDLDNLLMNQSLQHNTGHAQNQPSDEASEGSTCRAAHQPHVLPHHPHHSHHHHHHHQEPNKKEHDLSRFAAAVRHLQRHVVEIDRAVLAMTGDVGGTRQEMDGLKEAVSALQVDTHTITTTLSGLTQQAISAQHKISQATQEAERVQQIVSTALREAEWARQEQLKTKHEYEDLVMEVRSTLKAMKNSQDYHGANREAYDCTVKSGEEHKRGGTNFVATAAGSRGSGGSWTGPVVVGKSTSAPQAEKSVPSYQSLFSKPSNFISGLTARHSFTKSVALVDQKNKRKSEEAEAKAASLDRRMQEDKSPSRQEKKDKKEDISRSSLEKKKLKESKQHGSLEKYDKKDKHQFSLERKDKKDKHSKEQSSIDTSWGRESSGSIDRRERRGRLDKRGHVISGLSDDDIPMADDSHEVLVRSISPVTADPITTKVSTSKLTFNFSLGKSSSSPTVPYVSTANRPRALPLHRDRQSSETSVSNNSLDSPTASSPFPRPSSSTLPPLEESPPISETGSPSLLHRPGSTPGPMARQGSMTTVPEDREVPGPPPTKRSGVFAISRQHSSPNIPVQRQNSGSSFPLQRQSSLGTVPEGRLPRQESLISVPEDRVLVDRTLPISPSPSMSSFPLSPSASISTMSDSARQAARESMELVTGPVLAGSSMQEAAATGTLPVLRFLDEDDPPAATSTLKKDHKSLSKTTGILV